MKIKLFLILIVISTSLKAQVYLFDVEQSGWATELFTSINESTSNLGAGGAYVFNGSESINLSYNLTMRKNKAVIKSFLPSFNFLLNNQKRKYNGQLSVLLGHHKIVNLNENVLNYGFGVKLNRIFKLKSTQIIPTFNLSFSQKKEVVDDNDFGSFFNQTKYTIGGFSLGFSNTIMVKNFFVDTGLSIVNGLDPNYSFSVGYKIPK